MPAVHDTFKADLIEGQRSTYEGRVIGHVREQTTGWHVKLERASPQGNDPKVLLLNLVEQGPSGEAPKILTTHQVRYDEALPEPRYAKVTIEGAFTIDAHYIAYA